MTAHPIRSRPDGGAVGVGAKREGLEVMETDEEELLGRIPTDGLGVGNTRLMRELGWDEDRYWNIRNLLIDRGVLEAGRGRGGSVRRARVSEAAAPAAGSLPPSELDREADLYQPMAQALKDGWVKDERFESAVVQVTAMQGRRATGGTWSRPDITIAAVSTYPYVPGRHFDVVTFEVKPVWGVDVTAVYEALAHLRTATRSFCLFHIPDDHSARLEPVVSDICSEAKRHGVGVLVAEAPDDYTTWDERVEAVRSDPEPRKLNDFLAKQMTQAQLEMIVRWFR